MKAYNYHPVHGNFLDEEEIEESPLEPGVWLIPPNSTLVAPPPTKQNEISLWKGDRWEIEELKPTEMVKICPLIRQPCLKSLCEWFIPQPDPTLEEDNLKGECAILSLRLHNITPKG